MPKSPAGIVWSPLDRCGEAHLWLDSGCGGRPMPPTPKKETDQMPVDEDRTAPNLAESIAAHAWGRGGFVAQSACDPKQPHQTVLSGGRKTSSAQGALSR